MMSNEKNVLVFQEHSSLCRMGGSFSTLLDFRFPVVCLSVVEVCQYIYIILGFVLIRIGNTVWMAPGVTIGNPSVESL